MENNPPSFILSLTPALFSSVFRFAFVQFRFTYRAHLYFVRMEISLKFDSHSSYLTPFSTCDFLKFINSKGFKYYEKITPCPSQATSLSLPYQKSSASCRENKRSALILTVKCFPTVLTMPDVALKDVIF